MDFWENITIDDLPDEARSIAELIGLDNLEIIVKEYGGCALYIPRAKTISQIVRDRMIRNNFDGSNYRSLARQYNLCERRVREIISNSDAKE